MARTTLIAAALLAAGLGLAGCAEKPQTPARKSDVAAHQGNTGTHTVGSWKAGDAAAWEAQMKQRAQNGQNEYTRSAP